ncbi:MAG: T9SS type A sorting domain-containing protein [Prevotellaceae bacterium]|jgi:hypothetical protein|nr:T9SS type A sorting domain-containing protein [Prevotellaceae bacterium]
MIKRIFSLLIALACMSSLEAQAGWRITGEAVDGDSAAFVQTSGSEGEFVFTGKLSNRYFKVAGDAGSYVVECGDNDPLDKVLTLRPESDPSDVGLRIRYVLPTDFFRLTLKAERLTPPESLYIMGGPFNKNIEKGNWLLDHAIEMERDADNPFVFYYRGEIRYNTFGDERGSIKFLVGKTWSNNYHPVGETDVPLSQANKMRLSGGADSKWTIPKDGSGDGYYIIKINTLEETIEVEFFPEEPTEQPPVQAVSPADIFKVTLKAERIAPPQSLYIMGGPFNKNTEKGNWLLDHAIEMERDADNPFVFYYRGEIRYNTFGDERGSVKFLVGKAWGNNNYHPVGEADVPLSQADKMRLGGADSKWTIPEDGSGDGYYVIKINTLEKTIEVKLLQEGKDPDEDEGKDPDEDEGKDPDEDEGKDPDEDEGKDPDEDEGKDPDEDEGKDPDEDEGKTPNAVSAETFGMKLYPNPVRTELNISFEGEIAQVELVSLTGRKVLLHKVQGSAACTLNLQDVAAGCYVMIATLKNGAIVTQVITKQ